MLQLLRKITIATVAITVFLVTTLTGLVAGLLGALVRAQFPDMGMTEAERQVAAQVTYPAAKHVTDRTTARPTIGQAETGR